MIWFVAKRRGSCYGDRVGRCTTALQTHCCWNARGSHNFTVELPSVSVAFEDFLYHPNGKLAGSLWVRSDYPEKCAPSALQGNSRPCPKTNPHSSPLPRRKGVENSDGAMCNRLSLACHFQSRPKWDPSSTVKIFGHSLRPVQGTVQNSYRIVSQREPLDNGSGGSASSDYKYVLVLRFEPVGFDRSECSLTVCAVPDKPLPNSSNGID